MGVSIVYSTVCSGADQRNIKTPRHWHLWGEFTGNRWIHRTMMTSSNGNIFRVTGHLCGKFTGPRWITRTKASDAELWCSFDMRPNIRLSKQSWGWWFETPPQSLWSHRNAKGQIPKLHHHYVGCVLATHVIVISYVIFSKNNTNTMLCLEVKG